MSFGEAATKRVCMHGIFIDPRAGSGTTEDVPTIMVGVQLSPNLKTLLSSKLLWTGRMDT